MNIQEPVHDRRRRFMLQKLLISKEVPLSEIHDQFPDTAPQSIKDDIDHLIGLGVTITKKKVGRQVVLVNEGTSHHDLKQIRGDMRTAEKTLIAKMVAAVLCGFSEKPRTEDNLSILPQEFDDCPTSRQIQDQLHLSTKASSNHKYAQLLEVELKNFT